MPNLDLQTWMAVISVVLLVLLCLGIVARTVLIPAEVRRVPCCGACGHGVGDIRVERCPECGGVYTRVGITTPASVLRQRASLGLGLLAWTTAILAVTTVATKSVYGRAWSRAQAAWSPVAAAPASTAEHYQGEQKFSPWSAFGGAREAFRLEIAVDATEDAGKVTGTLTTTMRKSGTAEKCTLELKIDDKSYVLTDKSLAEIGKGAFGEEAVKQLFAALGLDPEKGGNPAYRKEIKELLEEAMADPESLQTHGQGGSFGNGPRLMQQGGSWTSGGRYGGAGWMPAAPFTGPGEVWTLSSVRAWWIALGSVWLVGAGVIAWRNRRLREGPRGTVSSPGGAIS
jgi:hypothetical protein